MIVLSIYDPEHHSCWTKFHQNKYYKKLSLKGLSSLKRDGDKILSHQKGANSIRNTFHQNPQENNENKKSKLKKSEVTNKLQYYYLKYI